MLFQTSNAAKSTQKSAFVNEINQNSVKRFNLLWFSVQSARNISKFIDQNRIRIGSGKLKIFIIESNKKYSSETRNFKEVNALVECKLAPSEFVFSIETLQNSFIVLRSFEFDF